jgi:hypothetical protein
MVCPQTKLRVVTDCALVVTRIHQGMAGLRKCRRGTGLWKQFFQIKADKQVDVQVCKTKAYRTRAVAEQQRDVEDFVGNDAVDKAANRGAHVYRGPVDEIEAELAKQKAEKAMIRWTAQRAADKWTEARFPDRGLMREGLQRIEPTVPP